MAPKNNPKDAITKRDLKEQLSIVLESIQHLQEKVVDLQRERMQLELLHSVSKGQYEEMDKLTKKAPAEIVSKLALEDANELIQETKTLIVGDKYIQRIELLVMAGDRPEQRDVLLTLRNVRQGLDRFEKALRDLHERTRNKQGEAVLIRKVIELALEDEVDPLKEAIRILNYNGFLPPRWIIDGIGLERFDFQMLKTTDLQQYFEQV